MKKDLNNIFYLAGQEEEPNYYIKNFPSKLFDGDTWRKKEYFEEFWELWPHDKKNAMEVLKKPWIDHKMGNSSKAPFRKTGELTRKHILSKCVDECPMCKRKMWYGRCCNAIDNPVEPSIDRLIARTLGGKYVDENVWIICRNCNTYKNNQETPDQMRKRADAWEKEILVSRKFIEEREQSPLLKCF